ncbi:MAG TPA: type II toxin-antitoxin system VapC family toxin [Pseudomonadota bacterium]|nr:type II toxin-antitoxin system VapC family toxin [Pseudomonadota bacterium]
MIILDTDVLSALMLRQPPFDVVTWLDQQPPTSVWTTSVTVFEIRYGLAIMVSGRRRIERELSFQRAIEEKLERRILPFDDTAAEEAASLMAVRRRSGRSGELRDTMIAGIALAQRATLATRNVRHFEDLAVPVVDPWGD